MEVYLCTATRATFLTTQNTIPQQNAMVMSDGGHRSLTVLHRLRKAFRETYLPCNLTEGILHPLEQGKKMTIR